MSGDQNLRDTFAPWAWPRMQRNVTSEVKRALGSPMVYTTLAYGASRRICVNAPKPLPQELAQGKLRIEPGEARLVGTRNEVQRAWLTVGDILIRERQPELAAHVRRFADQMAPPLTEKELVAARMAERTRDPRVREGPDCTDN